LHVRPAVVKFSEKVMQYVQRSINCHFKSKYSNPKSILLFIR